MLMMFLNYVRTLLNSRLPFCLVCCTLP
uniref:Uncharacterized protein n=1 Tax=Rhizophora mucronata TaxID=61149 RepID=A0A2P2N445_RHIMU